MPDLHHQDSSSGCFHAVAFDFDGTLVDTLALHYEAYRRVFEQLGLDLSEDQFYPNLGSNATQAIPLFLGGRKTTATVPEIHAMKKIEIASLFEHAPLRVFPAARFLTMFEGRFPMALVSSGARPGIIQLLERLGWERFFDVIVTGEDTPVSKPDPAPYLRAAELLAIPPASIAAFEDTPAGIASARAAGMAVFDVSGNLSEPT